jgi:hypothetical protein
MRRTAAPRRVFYTFDQTALPSGDHTNEWGVGHVWRTNSKVQVPKEVQATNFNPGATN